MAFGGLCDTRRLLSARSRDGLLRVLDLRAVERDQQLRDEVVLVVEWEELLRHIALDGVDRHLAVPEARDLPVVQERHQSFVARDRVLGALTRSLGRVGDLGAVRYVGEHPRQQAHVALVECSACVLRHQGSLSISDHLRLEDRLSRRPPDARSRPEAAPRGRSALASAQRACVRPVRLRAALVRMLLHALALFAGALAMRALDALLLVLLLARLRLVGRRAAARLRGARRTGAAWLAAAGVRATRARIARAGGAGARSAGAGVA